jgi:hypothetical protein
MTHSNRLSIGVRSHPVGLPRCRLSRLAGMVLAWSLAFVGPPAHAASPVRSSVGAPFPAATVRAIVTFSQKDKNNGQPKKYGEERRGGCGPEPCPKIKLVMEFFSDIQKQHYANINASYWQESYEQFREAYDSNDKLDAAARVLGLDDLEFADFDASPRMKCAGSSFYLSLGKRLGLPELSWDPNLFGHALRDFGEPMDPTAPGDIVMFSNDDSTAEHFALVADSWSSVIATRKSTRTMGTVTLWSKNGSEDFWVAEYLFPLEKSLYNNSRDAMISKLLKSTFKVQSYRFPPDLKVTWKYWTPANDRFAGWWIDKRNPDNIFVIGPSPEFHTKPADVNRHPLLITDIKNAEQISAAYADDKTIYATEWPRYRSQFVRLLQQHMGMADFQRYAAKLKFLATRGEIEAAGTKLTLSTPTVASGSASPRELVLEPAELFYDLKSVEVSRSTPSDPQWSAPQLLATGSGEEAFGWDRELAGGRVHSELNAKVAYCFPQAFPATAKYKPFLPTAKYGEDDLWEITGRPNLKLEVRDSEFKRQRRPDFRKKMGGATIFAELDDIFYEDSGQGAYRIEMVESNVPELKEGTTRVPGPILAKEVVAPSQKVKQEDLLQIWPKLTIVTSAAFAAATKGALRFKAVYELKAAPRGSRRFLSCVP